MAEVVIDVRAEDSFSSVLGNFGNIITGVKSAIDLIAGAAGAAADFIGQFTDSAAEGELTVAKMEAVIRATGGAAGLTSEQLQGMAGALQTVTRFSDEQILSATTVMLTFRNIGDEVMTRAIPLMLDMAEIFGSTDAAAMQLGKALNDPVNMMGALSRAGVTFSDAQKEAIKQMVEMGDLAGAQTLILDELERQVGGTAEAVGTTFVGKLEIAKNKIDEFKEVIGGPIITLLGGLLDKFMEFADTNPVIQSVLSFFERFNELLNSDASLGFFTALGGAVAQLNDISPIFTTIGQAMMEFQAGINSGLTPLESLKNVLSDLSLVWEGTPLEGIITQIQTFITTGETEGWGTAIGDLFSDIWGNLNLPAKIQELVNTLSTAIETTNWSGVVATMTDVLTRVMTGALNMTLAGLYIIVYQIDWSPLGAALRGALGEMWAGAFQGGEDGASIWGYIKLGFAAAIIGNPITLAGLRIGIAITDLLMTGYEIVQGIVTGIYLFIANVVTAAAALANTIISKVKEILGISSPSSVFMQIGKDILQGLIDGVNNMWNTVVTKFENLVAAILKPFEPILSLIGIELPGGGGTTGTTGGGAGDTSHDPRGGGTTGTTLTGTTTNNFYFYGTTYVNNVGPEGTFDCPSPHPIMIASSQSLLTSGVA